MNLIIDVGNTFVKLAVFQEDEIIDKSSCKTIFFKKTFNAVLKKHKNIKRCIVSSVGLLDENHIRLIKNTLPALILDDKTKLPFNNLYKTPKTLGVDRIALVSASVKMFPNSEVLIIDTGTCITYDFITVTNDYLGGAISPGVRLRYKSLNNLTANLPLLETEQPKDIIGNTTNSAIHSGVIHGILMEIDGVIDKYKLKYPHLTIILTGGDANFLSKQLKSSIFANSNFLLIGLNYILQFNSNE